MLKKNIPNDGFTLMEVVIATIVVGVLATLMMPQFSATIERVHSSEGVHILDSLLKAQHRYEIETGSFTNSLSDLDVTIPVSQYFNAITVNDADPLGQVSRRNGEYTLGINTNGTVLCTPIPGSNPICSKMGH